MKTSWAALSLLALGASGFPADAPPAAASYRADIETWRAQRETRLKAEGGWLSLAGLFWLEEGDNAFGSAPGGAVVLPEGAAPAHAGVFERRGGHVSVRLDPGVAATVAGQPVTSWRRLLRPSGWGRWR